MAYSTFTACSQIRCTGMAVHCDRKNVPCIEHEKTTIETVCAKMPTEIEALAELDNLIEGHCDRTSLKGCFCEPVGVARVTESMAIAEVIVEGIVEIFSWMGDRLRSLCGSKASVTSREYPTPPARPR